MGEGFPQASTCGSLKMLNLNFWRRGRLSCPPPPPRSHPSDPSAPRELHVSSFDKRSCPRGHAYCANDASKCQKCSCCSLDVHWRMQLNRRSPAESSRGGPIRQMAASVKACSGTRPMQVTRPMIFRQLRCKYPRGR